MNFHDMQQYCDNLWRIWFHRSIIFIESAALRENAAPNLKFPRSGVHPLLDISSENPLKTIRV